MTSPNIASEYTATWKYTPAGAQEYSEIQRGVIKVTTYGVGDAFAEAKRAVCAAHTDWDSERIEIVTVQEPFL